MLSPEGSFLKPYLSKQNDLIPACLGYLSRTISEKKIMQALGVEREFFKQAGCELLFTDTISGAKAERPGLKDALSHLRRDDTLVVWKLDRLGRTTKGLIDLVDLLKERGIGFKSLQDNIDTSTPMGQFFFVVFSAIAELERSMIRERSKADWQRPGPGKADGPLR